MKTISADLFFLTLIGLLILCPDTGSSQTLPQERHLPNIRQLTSGGKNAEAYFSFDGKKLVFVSNRNAKQPGEFNIFLADWIP